MSDMLKINVNDHTERKNGLTYLSWAWAWAEVLKIDPAAEWSAHEWNGMPAMFLPDGSAMVKVSVTIKGKTKECSLPVMDHRNKAIKNPDAFAVNTATMRCMTKAVSMHGLGLYIYAGEDLPEDSQEPERNANGTGKGKGAIGAAESAAADASAVLDDAAKSRMEDAALTMIEAFKTGNELAALECWRQAKQDQTEGAFLWGLLREEKALRSFILKNRDSSQVPQLAA